MFVVAAAATKSDDGGKRLSSPSGSSHTLLIVESHRRHIREHYGLQTPYIDPNFHRRCDAQDVNFIHILKEFSRPATHVHDNIAEEALPFRLIICLRSEFLAMKTYWLAALDCLLRVIVAAMQFSALCVMCLVQVVQAARADAACTMKVFPTA
jgi:hypothetical protein